MCVVYSPMAVGVGAAQWVMPQWSLELPLAASGCPWEDDVEELQLSGLVNVIFPMRESSHLDPASSTTSLSDKLLHLLLTCCSAGSWNRGSPGAFRALMLMGNMKSSSSYPVFGFLLHLLCPSCCINSHCAFLTALQRGWKI